MYIALDLSIPQSNTFQRLNLGINPSAFLSQLLLMWLKSIKEIRGQTMKENKGSLNTTAAYKIPKIFFFKKIMLFSFYFLQIYGHYLLLLLLQSPIYVFYTLNLSIFIECAGCYKCLSWSMDFWALSTVYYTKGRKLSCYTCYGGYIVLNSYMFFPDAIVMYQKASPTHEPNGIQVTMELIGSKPPSTDL